MSSNDTNECTVQWISGIQRGNEEVFEQLFKTYYKALIRFAWRYVRSNAIAEEIVQDVFADIWNDRQDWEPKGTIKSYLYKCVKHASIDHARHIKVAREYDEKWMEGREIVKFDYDDPRRKRQVQNAIKREIEKLPERSKMTYKLSRFDGLTYKEIADVMDVSVKTVESQMGRTLKRLREQLSYLLPVVVAGSYICSLFL